MTDKIIDFHNHIFPKKVASKVVNQLGNYYGMEMHGTAEVDNLLKLSKDAGMYKLVIHSTATKVEQVETINTYLGEVISIKGNGRKIFLTIILYGYLTLFGRHFNCANDLFDCAGSFILRLHSFNGPLLGLQIVQGESHNGGCNDAHHNRNNQNKR